MEDFRYFICKVITSQPARDVPGTSLEVPLKVLTSGTSRGLLGDQQKIDNLMKKCFLEAIGVTRVRKDEFTIETFK